MKIADEQGNATVLDAIYGVQFAVDHKAAYNIRVINLSVESEAPQSYKTDPLDAAVEAAWFRGIVVVAAAGNRGNVPGAVGYAPGNDPYVITVGSVDDRATKSVSDDVITTWSSRGVTQDGYAKPEIYAPGAHIVANLAPNSAFASMCPMCIVDGAYIRAGGTSLSAPIVAGAAAAILERNPTWTPNMVKGALLSTMRTIVGGREIDALNAYNASTDKLKSNAGLYAEHARQPEHRRHRLHASIVARRRLEHGVGPALRDVVAGELAVQLLDDVVGRHRSRPCLLAARQLAQHRLGEVAAHERALGPGARSQRTARTHTLRCPGGRC